MRITQDSGVMETFIEDEYYCGVITDIFKFDFRTFNVYAFDVKWFMRPIGRGPASTIRRHPSGLPQIDSTRFWTSQDDTLVLPEHCEQVHCISIHIINLGQCT